MISLANAIVYDCECFPNAFTMNAQGLFSDLDMTFEISSCANGRDHRQTLFQWFAYWRANQTPMIGFNTIGYDYNLLHFLDHNPNATPEELYEFSMSIINNYSGDRFGTTVFPSDRFAPQIDLYKIHHFDNRAKSTSLKALQVNMRSDTVMESPVPFGQPVTRDEIDRYVIPYNKHDVAETQKFAHISMDAIKFRLGLMATLNGDVLNWSDTKIGGKILEQRLGISSRIETTYRDRIALRDIIFPYVQFRNPEFNRVLEWMRTQTLAADDLTENIKTKGVFTGVSANVGGLEFNFGTGGIHASVAAGIFKADAEWAICDIDVTGLYPSIAIVNRLYPEHLGERFVEEYSRLPVERARYKKGTVENSALKLAANGTYGNSNNQYSVFYDPEFTMTITINGQLMLCMLAEWLLTVPTLQIIQANTDGITYRIRHEHVDQARQIRTHWEKYTILNLEEAQYSRMWIRDVNNYIAETTEGKLKQKGAYWFPRKFPDDITNGSPPAWHKDFSAVITTMAAVEHMVNGTDIERYIYGHGNPFDFMLRAKVDRSSKLMLGDKECQRITRYYVAHNGAELKKVSPPVKGARVGEWKRRNGITDSFWEEVRSQVGDQWDERIHTKNKSKYEIREMAIESGFKVAECNRAADFDFGNVNYDWYVEKARKLVIV